MIDVFTHVFEVTGAAYGWRAAVVGNGKYPSQWTNVSSTRTRASVGCKPTLNMASDLPTADSHLTIDPQNPPNRFISPPSCLKMMRILTKQKAPVCPPGIEHGTQTEILQPVSRRELAPRESRVEVFSTCATYR